MEDFTQQLPLEQLPLHDITRLHGAQGLEDRLNLELDKIDFGDAKRAQIDDALRLSLYAHENQPRGEHPYSTHTLRVANRIIIHFGVTDPEVIIAALLHDSVEDQPGRLIGAPTSEAEDPKHQAAALSFIGERFGTGVRNLVAAVTNPKFDSSRSMHEQYREHVVETMEEADPRARLIKLSDFIDNCSGLIYNEDPKRAKRLAEKYMPLIPAMAHYARDTDTPLSADARSYIVERLDRAQVRCINLLAAA